MQGHEKSAGANTDMQIIETLMHALHRMTTEDFLQWSLDLTAIGQSHVTTQQQVDQAVTRLDFIPAGIVE